MADPYEPNPLGYTSPVPFNTLWSRAIIVASVVLAIVATVFVCLRFQARRKSKQSFGWDDWSIVLGLVWATEKLLVFECVKGMC